MAWQLSNKQRKIIECIAEGMSPKKIADTLSIDRKTVYRHLDNIRKSLEVHNSIEYYIL